jgi:hypothetical protein
MIEFRLPDAPFPSGPVSTLQTVSIHPRTLNAKPDHGSSTKIGFCGVEKWLDIPCGGEKIVNNGPPQFIDTMNNKTYWESWIKRLEKRNP